MSLKLKKELNKKENKLPKTTKTPEKRRKHLKTFTKTNLKNINSVVKWNTKVKRQRRTRAAATKEMPHQNRDDTPTVPPRHLLPLSIAPQGIPYRCHQSKNPMPVTNINTPLLPRPPHSQHPTCLPPNHRPQLHRSFEHDPNPTHLPKATRGNKKNENSFVN